MKQRKRQRKKLLVVIPICSGGCFQYARELVVRLDRETDIYLNTFEPEQHDIRSFHPIRTYGYGKLSRVTSLLTSFIAIYIKTLLGKYNGLLLLGPSDYDPFYASVFAAACRKPIFYVVHDGERHTGDGNDRFYRRLERATRTATHLIFLSRYVQNNLKEKFGIDKPSAIVPHGLIDYGKIPSIARRKPEKPVLLFLGRLSVYKGIDLLLEALEQVDDSLYEKVIIAGQPINDYQVTTRLPKVKIDSRFLSEKEMLAYLQEADILLFPYRDATQSGVATLAINYLLPSMVTEVGGLTEQFSAGTCLFVRPEVDEMREAIRRLCTESILYDSISQELLRLRAQYSYEEIAGKLNTFLAENIK